MLVILTPESLHHVLLPSHLWTSHQESTDEKRMIMMMKMIILNDMKTSCGSNKWKEEEAHQTWWYNKVPKGDEREVRIISSISLTDTIHAQDMKKTHSCDDHDFLLFFSLPYLLTSHDSLMISHPFPDEKDLLALILVKEYWMIWCRYVEHESGVKIPQVE